MGEDYLQFVQRFHQTYGVNLALYKQAQMQRRLTSFRDKHKLPTFSALFQAIGQSTDIRLAFFDKMTINVTEFFRNRKRWEALEEIAESRWDKKCHNPVKIWSAACSSGEEPYTLSILFSEVLKSRSFSIDATDIDVHMLERAQAGEYVNQSLRELEDSEVDKYFTREQGFYKIKPSYKSSIRFSKHDLLADGYEKTYDLIVCRNVLIYFTDQAKETVFHKFADALKPGGVLFVGSTEQIFNAHQYGLAPIGKFLYEKR